MPRAAFDDRGVLLDVSWRAPHGPLRVLRRGREIAYLEHFEQGPLYVELPDSEPVELSFDAQGALSARRGRDSLAPRRPLRPSSLAALLAFPTLAAVMLAPLAAAAGFPEAACPLAGFAMLVAPLFYAAARGDHRPAYLLLALSLLSLNVAGAMMLHHAIEELKERQPPR